jgi:hypothetical protein
VAQVAQLDLRAFRLVVQLPAFRLVAPNKNLQQTSTISRPRRETSARVDAYGSIVTVQPETIVQSAGDELVLDHGSLQVDTSRGMRVRPSAHVWSNRCQLVRPLPGIDSVVPGFSVHRVFRFA